MNTKLISDSDCIDWPHWRPWQSWHCLPGSPEGGVSASSLGTGHGSSYRQPICMYMYNTIITCCTDLYTCTCMYLSYQSRYDIAEGWQGEIDLSGLLETLTLSGWTSSIIIIWVTVSACTQFLSTHCRSCLWLSLTSSQVHQVQLAHSDVLTPIWPCLKKYTWHDVHWVITQRENKPLPMQTTYCAALYCHNEDCMRARGVFVHICPPAKSSDPWIVMHL